MRLEINNGFLDLKQALKEQDASIRQLIDEVAQDIKFETHRVVLIRAYGLFTQALDRFRSAMQVQDPSRRNSEIDAVRQMLFQALADYSNPQLLEETCAAGKLRRLECTWAIEQAIIATYQVQDEMLAVSDRLNHLQNQIRSHACMIIDACHSDCELDFLFPEMNRIYKHDLAVIDLWQNRVDWMHSLPPSEIKLLDSVDFQPLETNNTINVVATPTEQLTYERLTEKSHFDSLRDQLLLMYNPQLRQQYETYISQKARVAGYKTLVPNNLQQASNLTVANLYHYFRN